MNETRGMGIDDVHVYWQADNDKIIIRMWKGLRRNMEIDLGCWKLESIFAGRLTARNGHLISE